MYYVYIIECNEKTDWYVGITNDVHRRLAEHNNGHSSSTRKFKNWKLHVYLAFSDLTRAQNFERYLKSHSGRSFAKKRL